MLAAAVVAVAELVLDDVAVGSVGDLLSDVLVLVLVFVLCVVAELAFGITFCISACIGHVPHLRRATVIGHTCVRNKRTWEPHVASQTCAS